MYQHRTAGRTDKQIKGLVDKTRSHGQDIHRNDLMPPDRNQIRSKRSGSRHRRSPLKRSKSSDDNEETDFQMSKSDLVGDRSSIGSKARQNFSGSSLSSRHRPKKTAQVFNKQMRTSDESSQEDKDFHDSRTNLFDKHSNKSVYSFDASGKHGKNGKWLSISSRRSLHDNSSVNDNASKDGKDFHDSNTELNSLKNSQNYEQGKRHRISSANTSKTSLQNSKSDFPNIIKNSVRNLLPSQFSLMPDGKEEKFYDSSTNLVDSENDSRVSGNTSQSSRFKTGTSIRSSISRPTRSRKSKKVSDTEVSDTTASSAEELTTIWSEKAAEQQRKNANKRKQLRFKKKKKRNAASASDLEDLEVVWSDAFLDQTSLNKTQEQKKNPDTNQKPLQQLPGQQLTSRSAGHFSGSNMDPFFYENLLKLDSSSEESSTISFPRPSFTFGTNLVNRAMKFIQSAAGDDDEENEEQIRRLQEDLKVMLQKCKALELEQSASRKWIKQHEYAQKDLEKKIKQNESFFQTQFSAMQKKLKKTQSEANSVRSELDEVVKLKDDLENENEEARETILKLKQQIEEEQKRNVKITKKLESLLEKAEKKSKSTQVLTMESKLLESSSSSDSENFLKKLLKENPSPTEESDNNDESNAQLYQRMVTSLKTMRAQMEDLRACKLALETGLTDFNKLKLMLSEETKRRQSTENELEKERYQSRTTKEDYDETRQILRQLVTRQQRDSIQTLADLARCVQKIQLENFDIDLDHMAWCFTYEAIDQAAIQQQQTQHNKQIELFKLESVSYNRMMSAAQESLALVQEQVDELKRQLVFRNKNKK